VKVYGLSIFYREAGPANAPTLFLLRVLLPLSRMYQPLFARLAGQFHLLSPDYPGFGRSDAPDPQDFAYTLDYIPEVIGHFTGSICATLYAHYLEGYGGLVGFRLAPAHKYGLRLSREARRQFCQNRAAHEAAFCRLKVDEGRRQAGSTEDRLLDILITQVEWVGEVVVRKVLGSLMWPNAALEEINLCARQLPVKGVSR
jgi:pimeloyl-ACP methyl ester carboxylesterase